MTRPSFRNVTRAPTVVSGITSYSNPPSHSLMYCPWRFGSTGSAEPPSNELFEGVVVRGVVLAASGEKL